MRRVLVCVAALAALGVAELDAQQCRSRHGRTECRDRSRNWVVMVREESSRPVPQFGVRGGYDFEGEVGSAGAQLRVPVFPELLVVPSADVFFGGDRTDWQINGDLVVRPAALAGLYGGFGVALTSRDTVPFELDDEGGTELGVNLLVGLESGRIRRTTLRPFAEARWTRIDDAFPFRLVAGFNVPIAGR
ncbi:MAG TPA: hypothetical protein VGR37_17050 [Longimicrobiaceae bacterium]|nr:hypothetical protein [Longimicrobiaceae bacterium]